MSQNAPESISERLKFQKFSVGGGYPHTPLADVRFARIVHMLWPHHLNLACSGSEICCIEESKQSRSNSRYENCTEGDQLYRNALELNYSEGDSGSYWCRIVIDGAPPLSLQRLGEY